MNAYEDLLNDLPVANLVSPDLEDFADFVLDEAHLANPIISEDANLPNAPTFKEAMTGPEHDQWHKAILEEMSAIKDAGTWELIDSSPNVHNIIGCWFVLQKKCGSDGNVTKFKACLVAQGFGQCEGIDYSETFALVVKSASLWIFLTICAHHGWRARQMDIKSVYLNGSISEDIYMHQPKGAEDKIAKLKKGLYGLKQAGQEWYTTLHDFLIQLGFCHTHADHSVFIFE